MDPDGGASLASTVPEDLEEDVRRRRKSPAAFTVAEDRALAAAVAEHHADAAALARYRAVSLHASGAARTCCWGAIAALFSQRSSAGSAGRHGRLGLRTRFARLVALHVAQLPAAWLTKAAANAARRRALAAAAAAAAAGVQLPPPPAAAPAARKRAREEAPPAPAAAPAQNAAAGAWSAAEEAHLLALLARFPAHGEPSSSPGGRGSDADTAFWARIAACLQPPRGAEGSGAGSGARTAYAAYKRATMLQRR